MLLEFFDFVDWIKSGELTGALLGVFLAALFGQFVMSPGRITPRFSVSKGRREVSITYVAERPTAENQYNRDWARGELADGQEVWVSLDKPVLRRSSKVTATILCTEAKPYVCVGQMALPVMQTSR